MKVELTWINSTKGHGCGEDVWDIDGDLGEVYRKLRSEFGRCTSKVYIGEGQEIGWVFEKRVAYTDAKSARDTYLQETWCTPMKRRRTVTFREYAMGRGRS